MNDSWQRMLKILEKCLKPGIFQVWIKPLQADFKGQELILEAPNEFVASWVRERLKGHILEAAKEVLGLAPKISICSSKKAPEKMPLNLGRAKVKEQLGLPIHTSVPKTTINFRYSFDNFVVGPCNELAFVASKTFCSQSISSDQLFLCSGPGLGKTHLVQAVGKELSSECNRSNVRIAYLTAEEFACHLIMAIKSKQIEQFKARFRDNIDILLLEDIHFFQGKEKMQNEFLSTIKSLQNQGKKVVFSSTFLPRELDGVDGHLVSRLCQGFLAVIEKPDFETRVKIVHNKARSFQVSIPEEVGELLAEKIQNDVRQLESCLQNLIFKAKLLKERISLDLAWQVLKNYGLEEQTFDLKKIIQFVAGAFDLPVEALSSKSRKKQCVLARNTAFYLARKYTDHSLKEIGQQFNRRHSTVLKGIANVEREISKQTPLGRQLAKIIERLEQ
ncbi:chromosomal replication initiator protein DnaA [Desulfovulcanus ferrireducens]|jgi:chromosomal replication initiator protein|uniref:chromosomal replication initiator protein DnaA n=1 Tax=Desulfovulcanus ferrireducens TaxID=2831190 RepID=UPI0025A38FE0|nr:chromosomal replication initiator protein DnaA [Desulfovulcanus ferrireducens]